MLTRPEPDLQRKLEALGILSPVAEEVAPLWQGPPAVEGLEGKVVGFLDNTWGRTHQLLSYLRELFCQAYPLKETLLVSKEVHSRPAPPQLIEELASRCHLVITGTAG